MDLSLIIKILIIIVLIGIGIKSIKFLTGIIFKIALVLVSLTFIYNLLVQI